jgi:hypothetical protein
MPEANEAIVRFMAIFAQRERDQISKRFLAISLA